MKFGLNPVDIELKDLSITKLSLRWEAEQFVSALEIYATRNKKRKSRSVDRFARALRTSVARSSRKRSRHGTRRKRTTKEKRWKSRAKNSFGMIVDPQPIDIMGELEWKSMMEQETSDPMVKPYVRKCKERQELIGVLTTNYREGKRGWSIKDGADKGRHSYLKQMRKGDRALSAAVLKETILHYKKHSQVNEKWETAQNMIKHIESTAKTRKGQEQKYQKIMGMTKAYRKRPRSLKKWKHVYRKRRKTEQRNGKPEWRR